MDYKYQSDCKFIQDILIDNTGEYYTLEECHEMWSNYSDSYCAGWLIINDESKEEIIEVAKQFKNKKKIEHYEILDFIENLEDYEKHTLLRDLADKYCFNCFHNKYDCICVPGY